MLFFFQAEDGIRDLVRSRGLGDVYKRQGECQRSPSHCFAVAPGTLTVSRRPRSGEADRWGTCLLYTSDAADERSSVDLGGRRIIKKKTKADICLTTCSLPRCYCPRIVPAWTDDRDRVLDASGGEGGAGAPAGELVLAELRRRLTANDLCLLYTSDAADERSSVDLGGRRIIKKKHQGKARGRQVWITRPPTNKVVADCTTTAQTPQHMT